MLQAEIEKVAAQYDGRQRGCPVPAPIQKQEVAPDSDDR
jgi:hypothetical protein